MLVRPGFEPATSRSADRRSPNWANQAAVKRPNRYFLITVWATNHSSKAKSCNCHFHKYDVKWPIGIGCKVALGLDRDLYVAHAVADPDLQIREGGTDPPDPSPRSATAHVRQLLQYIHFTHLVQPTLVSKTWAEVKNRIMYSICVHQRLRLKPKVRILTLAQYCGWDSRESNFSSTVSSNTFKHQP